MKAYPNSHAKDCRCMPCRKLRSDLRHAAHKHAKAVK